MFIAVLCTLSPLSVSARNLDCVVRYECSGGSCKETSRHYRTHAGPEKIGVQSQGYATDLVMLDKTSSGDLVYGGQIGPNFYGVFFLAPSNGAQLMLQGVNGWSENKTEMLICTEATG
ncbi:hypothetical protein M3484_01495 [Pseudomonas sp. GX19020]|uniref:hypothetical protein n=1 Tax=Pseudomonas sp. GX19020 TaxID=2942277 RepID=UPI002018CBA8|nr:hypothetical protein [Pseudomonas sp. GX19020]MCL4065250.1 hypothetical protein [Pseudomonas sp. GX19020]